jgi:phosphatidate phosphatase APP1
MARSTKGNSQHIGAPAPVNAALAGAALICAAASLAPRDAAAAPARARIVIFNGLGTPARARIWGRVLEDKGHGKARVSESWYRKMRRNLSALESDEIPNARLKLKVLGRSYPLQADREGMFSLELSEGLTVGDHKVTASLRGKRSYRVEPGRLLIWPQKPGLLVISDIDDTVLDTGVTSKWKLVKRVLVRSSRDLRSFDHCPALYRAWSRRGAALVFVSGSPVNLYPQLEHFLSLHRFPAAPLLLKKLGRDPLTEQVAYKLRQIELALGLLPGYRLILVGDSGEKDPEIYREVTRRHKKRVLLAAIHRVTDEEAGAARFSGQLLFKNYNKLARELKRRDLLTDGEYRAIRDDRKGR